MSYETAGTKTIKFGMRNRKTIWTVASLLATLVLLGFSIFFASTPKIESTTSRIARIESNTKCPSCDGESVLNSQSASAALIRQQITNLVKNGDSDDRVIETLRSEYGNAVYSDPPGINKTLLIWLPTLLILGGLIYLIYLYISRRQKVASKILPTIIPFVSPKTLISRFSQLGKLRKVLLVGGIAFIISGISLLAVSVVGDGGNTSNTADLIAAARFLASADQPASAIRLYQEVLNLEPNQPEALAEEGWLIAQIGGANNKPSLVSLGIKDEKKSIEADKKYPEPYLFLGAIYYEIEKNPNLAVSEFKVFLSLKPSAELIQAGKSDIVAAFKADNLEAPISP